MNHDKLDQNSIIGHVIQNVQAVMVGGNDLTGADIYNYIFELSNGNTLELSPSRISYFDGRATNKYIPEAQVIDGPPTIIGERVVGVVTRRGTGLGVAASEATETEPRQVALVLSSGRGALDVYRCGGGSTLHIESLAGIARFLGRDWRNYWNEQAVSLEELLRQI